MLRLSPQAAPALSERIQMFQHWLEKTIFFSIPIFLGGLETLIH